jgi:putative transcriptional regulator
MRRKDRRPGFLARCHLWLANGTGRDNLSRMSDKSPPQTVEGTSFLEGKLLIALPGMTDPRFERSVIFMCAHSLESGAMGICINRPIDGLTFRELADKLDIPSGPGTPDFPILYGGPVDTGRGFVLHSSDYDGEESTLPISEEVSLTATLDILRAIAAGKGPAQAIFALGYAGWREGQIEEEICANAWIHCDADTDILFGRSSEAKWAAALHKLGIDISGLTANAGRA